MSTPGPWKMTLGRSTCAVKQEGALGYLCEMSDYARQEQIANARLIAAAPEMLAALKKIDWLFASGQFHEITPKLLQKLIAKAEGRDE